jgi:hypothetical protein
MLLVLGPHRSGTSLTACMLECLGAVNSKNLNPPNEFNPKGYFEDLDIYFFNESVLMPALQTSWHAVSPINWLLLPEPGREELLERAVELIRKNYDAANALSVLKEPRISQLLPFWLEALTRAGFTVKVVCPVRDSTSVARSIALRDNLPLAIGLLLYIRIWHAVLRQIGDIPAAYFDFEEIFAGAPATIARIGRFLHLPLPADFGSRIESFTKTHLDPGLVHHQREAGDSLMTERRPQQMADGLHRLLLRCCQTQESDAARQYCESVAADLEKVTCYLGALDELAEKQVMRENAARHLRSRNAPPQSAQSLP